jgi:hypothetical protein
MLNQIKNNIKYNKWFFRTLSCRYSIRWKT